ncbi:MAG: hypothetical protein ACHQUC_06175 [Chlamydiales bacterium]
MMRVIEINGSVEIYLEKDTIGYLVHGRKDPKESPWMPDQHANCVLSTGQPVGFANRDGPACGGSSGSSWNLVGFNRGKVLGYDLMCQHAPLWVKFEEAKEANYYSMILFIEGVDREIIANFDDFWLSKILPLGQTFDPFHLIGRNCSSFAYESFKTVGLLSKPVPALITTPLELLKHLNSELKARNYKLTCFSGIVGFEPVEKNRSIRTAEKNSQYVIVVEKYKNLNKDI